MTERGLIGLIVHSAMVVVAIVMPISESLNGNSRKAVAASVRGVVGRGLRLDGDLGR